MAEEASRLGVQNQVDERLTTLKLEIDEINLTRDPSNDKEADAQNTLCDELDPPQTLFVDIFEQLKELEEKVSKCLQNQDLLLHVVRRVTSLENNFEQFKKNDSKKSQVEVTDTEVPPIGNSRLQRRSTRDSAVNNHDQMEMEGSESSDSDPSDSDNNDDNDWQPPNSDSEPDLGNSEVKTTRSSNRTTSKQRTENNVENVDVDLLDSVTKVKVEDEDWQPSQSEDTDSENGLTDEMETKESNSAVPPPKPNSEAQSRESRQSKIFKCGLCPSVFPEKHVMDRHHFIHAAGLEFRCFGCNIQFGSLEDLNEHNHSMHGENKTCTTCKKVFRRPRDIMSHLRNVHGINRPYNCVRCKRSFKDRGDLLNHEIKHHGGRKIYENAATTQENELSGRPPSQVENAILNCKICSAKLQNTQKLYRHYRTQHLDFLSAYKCKICEDAFFNAELLAHHYSERHPVITDRTPSTATTAPSDPVIPGPTHSTAPPADPPEFTCSECKELLTSQRSLTEHLRTVHGLGKYIRCALCQTYFTRRDKVKAHLLEVHGQSGRLKNVEYPCQRCNRSFRENKLFNLHIPKCLGLKPFQCDICGVSLSTKNGLLAHIKNIHEGQTSQGSQGQEKVICPECGKEIRRCYLTSHLKTHQEEAAFNCEICGHPYAHRTDLLAHMETHTGVKNLSCTFCDKKFSHQRTLKIHIKTHTTGKNHKCTSCGKAFRLKSTLRIHFRTHTGEKLFGCELCGKRYRQDQGLKIHMRAHERGKGRSLYLKPEDKDKGKDVCEKSSDLHHEEADAVCANDNNDNTSL